MVFYEIAFIYEDTKKAIEYLNALPEKNKFDLNLLRDNLAEDVMTLTARAACADGAITREELIKINKLLAEFEYGVNESECDEILKTIMRVPVEIPKTLSLLTFKAKMCLNSTKHLGPAIARLAIQYDLLVIGRVITAYASIMRYAAIENGLVPSEQKTIINYIDNCINYVERELGEKMEAYCNYKPLLKQQNFTPIYAPAAGKIAHMPAKENEAITYNSLFAIINSNGSLHNVLAPAHGTLYKLKFKPGDTVKKSDLLAIIAM
jgi:hypothetical protein